MTAPLANDNWGAGARIGLFIVGAEVVPEAEWWAMAPPGVSIHAARVTAPTPWAEWRDGAVVLAPDLARGAAQFSGMALSAAVLAHSSSSIAAGPGWDSAVAAHLTDVLHPATQATTNGLDCVLALEHLGVHRPFLVFPPWFGEATVAKGAGYFTDHGLAVAGAFRQVPEARWADTAPQNLYREGMHLHQNTDLLFDQIVAECPADADGVLIAGTGFRCVAIIDALEAALGRPVVTANQASLWRCLDLVGAAAPISGYGRLLA